MSNFWGHHPFPGAAYAGTDRSNDKWPGYEQYPGSAPLNNGYNNHHHHHQQHGNTTTQSNARWDSPSSSSQNWHSADPDVEEDPDGLPYERDEQDSELTRKRKELQVIEEKIMLKRASLALKTVDVKTCKPTLCTEESELIESNKTLRERVKHILQLRNRVFGINGPVDTSRRRCLSVLHDHPLKRKVETALQQRFVRPPVEPEKCKLIPFLGTPAPSQKDPSPEKEEVNKSNQGFLRFLNILNKGVDIDKLTEIVNDETGNLSHSDPNGIEIPSATSPLEPPRIERKKLEEEEQPSSTNEQRMHLQNILDSLGLSLGTDEISRLSDRTQERLYGRKQSTEKEALNTFEEKAHKGEEKYSPGHYTRSSSSSSCSSSVSSSLPSRSSSRTPSPFRRQRSPSPIRSSRRSSWSPRRSSHSHSPHSRMRDSRSAHKSPRDDQNSHLKYLPQMQPHPHPPSQYFSPHFLPQAYPNAYCYSQYTAYYNHFAYNQALIQEHISLINQNFPKNIPPLLPNLKSNQDKNIYVQQPPPLGTEINSSKPFAEMEDIQKLLKEDRSRCLVTVKQMGLHQYQQMMNVRKQMNKARKRRGERRRKMRRRLEAKEIRKNQQIFTPGPKKKKKKKEEEKKEEKKPLTEEEIKANLKKTLEAFNSRMKKNGTQPAGLLMAQAPKVEDEI